MGRGFADCGQSFRGVVFRLRTGVPRRDLPPRFGPSPRVGPAPAPGAAWRAGRADQAEVMMDKTAACSVAGVTPAAAPEWLKG